MCILSSHPWDLRTAVVRPRPTSAILPLLLWICSWSGARDTPHDASCSASSAPPDAPPPAFHPIFSHVSGSSSSFSTAPVRPPVSCLLLGVPTHTGLTEKIRQRRQPKNTHKHSHKQYTLRAIPVGGYVSFPNNYEVDDDGVVTELDDPDLLYNR